jgi:MFS family permease
MCILPKIDPKQLCCLSYRLLSGTADAAFWGSVVSILMKLFPKHVATIAAWTEMLFRLGYMLGNALLQNFYH